MAVPKSEFLRILTERGFIHQCSDLDGLDKLLREQIVTAYIGFDATAKSLHVGNLLGIMMLRWLQQCGHRPLVLMGGGTTRVGDPSGKDDMRRLLDEAAIDANKEALKQNFAPFLRFGAGPADAVMADNAEWLLALNYVDLLRRVGRHFTVNRMLTFDSVRLRLEREQPLTFLEFNYMILQAYDFVELYKRTGCRLQMGGSDQWGNIVNGIDLGRRLENAELFALTCPLLTTSSGAKMGKTAAGAVWLSDAMFSAYDYWQYWRNAEDADVGRFMRLFTEMPIAEIVRYESLQGAELNEAKKVLATRATAMLHGEAAAEQAAQTARATFEDGTIAASLPRVEISQTALDSGLGLLSACVTAGFATSNAQARRHIRGGGIRLNDELISDERLVLGVQHLNADGLIKLSHGKKRHVLLTPVQEM